MSVKRWGISIFVVFVLAFTAVGAFVAEGQASADGSYYKVQDGNIEWLQARNIARSAAELWCTYSRRVDQQYQIKAAYSIDGRTWTEEHVFSHGWSTVSSYQPCIAINNSGMVWVFWTMYNNGVYYRTRTPGDEGGWGNMGTLDGNVNARYPECTFDRGDNLHVVWQSGLPCQINYRRWNGSAESWEGITVLASVANKDQSDPAVATDYNNHVHVVWTGAGWGNNPNYPQILYREYNGSAWLDTVLLTDSASYHGKPSIVVDSYDRIHVTWHTGTSPNPNGIEYRMWDGQWSEIFTVSTSGLDPSVGLDSADNVHIAWHTYNPYNVQHRAKVGGVWGDVEEVIQGYTPSLLPKSTHEGCEFVWLYTAGGGIYYYDGVPDEPEPWSFAVITDLHIGEGYPGSADYCNAPQQNNDYGTVGWNDYEDSGQETYQWCDLRPNIHPSPTPPTPTPTECICCCEVENYSITDNLKDVIGLINSSIGEYNIQFVVIDGDLTDSAEISEMDKARDLLDELDVPWIPIIGNHDIWPYSSVDEALPVDVNSSNDIPNGACADYYFNKMIESQYAKLSTELPDWSRPNPSVPNNNLGTDTPHISYFQNFAFNYSGYHFIGLDFNNRNTWLPPVGPGVHAEADLFVTKWDPFTTLPGGTWDWFKSNLEGYVNNSGVEDVILFAHHPMASRKCFTLDPSVCWCYTSWVGWEAAFQGKTAKAMYDDFLKGYKDRILAEFSGHTHINYEYPSTYNVMDIYETDANKEGGGQVRIVTLYPGNLEKPLETKTITLYKSAKTSYGSPYMSLTDPLNRVVNWSVNEIPGAEYRQFDFDGDGKLDAQILLPENIKMADYTIQVFPYEGATSNDTYTLVVSPAEEQFGYTDIVIAENQSFGNESYTFQFKDRIATNLSYTGDISGYFGDAVNMSATLTDNSSNPLSDKTIYFWLGNQSVSAVTDSGGNASAQLVLDQPPSEFYTFGADFTGDADYLPSYNISYFEILSPYDKDWNCWQTCIVAANETCGDLTSYQMELTLHYGLGWSSGSDVYLASNASSDFSDVRFLDEDRLTPLDYWVQDCTVNDKATVWVEFNNISTMGTFFYIYYGNPVASSASNGSNTFMVFNDGTSINESEWKLQADGATFNWAAVDGAIRATSDSGGWSNLYYNMSLGTDCYVAEAEIRAQDGNTSDDYRQGIGYGNSDPLACWLETSNEWVLNDSIGESYSAALNEGEFDATSWHDYRFVKNGSYWESFVDGDPKVVRSDAENVSQYAGMYAQTDEADHWVEFDDFRVREYCYPEPLFGTWAEAYPTPTPSPTPTAAESQTPTISPTESPTPTISSTESPTVSPTMSPTPTISPTVSPTPTEPPRSYGDVNDDGYITTIDRMWLNQMLIGTRPVHPSGDVNMDGWITTMDKTWLNQIIMGYRSAVNMHEGEYDFSSGAGSDRWAKRNNVTAPPPALNETFDTDPTGWVEATSGQYTNILAGDGDLWTIAGVSGNCTALQCKFTVAEGAYAGNLTSIGISFNGSSQDNGDLLQFWAWNISASAWQQLDSDISLGNTSNQAYIKWTAWGKVYSDYIDSNNCIYILYTHNTTGKYLNVDYVKLAVVAPE